MSQKTRLYNINKREKRKVKRLQRQENVITQLRHEKEAITRTVGILERDLKVSKCSYDKLVTTLSAASVRSAAGVMGSPLSCSINSYYGCYKAAQRRTSQFP